MQVLDYDTIPTGDLLKHLVDSELNDPVNHGKPVNYTEVWDQWFAILLTVDVIFETINVSLPENIFECVDMYLSGFRRIDIVRVEKPIRKFVINELSYQMWHNCIQVKYEGRIYNYGHWAIQSDHYVKFKLAKIRNATDEDIDIYEKYMDDKLG